VQLTRAAARGRHTVSVGNGYVRTHACGISRWVKRKELIACIDLTACTHHDCRGAEKHDSLPRRELPTSRMCGCGVEAARSAVSRFMPESGACTAALPLSCHRKGESKRVVQKSRESYLSLQTTQATPQISTMHAHLYRNNHSALHAHHHLPPPSRLPSHPYYVHHISSPQATLRTSGTSILRPNLPPLPPSLHAREPSSAFREGQLTLVCRINIVYHICKFVLAGCRCSFLPSASGN
jgi:hypothetical protein